MQLGREFLNGLDELLSCLESENKQLIITDVIHWLPFEKENYDKFTDLISKDNCMCKFEDGTEIDFREQHPLAIMTHFGAIN